MGPMFGVGQVLLGLLAVAGIIFSLVMLVDCLKRKPGEFANPLTKSGEYDKLIWAAAIVASLWFYFLGAIVYFIIVQRAKPEKAEKQE
jgi:uncharacterized BrkB/YihY/UPF0761 family membrane protein